MVNAEMTVYERQARLVPRWFVGVLAGVLAVGTAGIWVAGEWDRLAGAPMMALFWYGWAIAAVNRTRVSVDRRQVEAAQGPLPVGAGRTAVPAGEVARVYVRHAWMPTRTGAVPYLAAGVERRNGRWLDLVTSMEKGVDAWREARAIADALGTPDPVVELRGGPPVRDWQAMRVVFLWTGAFVGAMLWGLYVEEFLRRG